MVCVMLLLFVVLLAAAFFFSRSHKLGEKFSRRPEKEKRDCLWLPRLLTAIPSI